MPYLVSRAVEVRRILEDFSAEAPKLAPVLTEAYGIMLFKCPIINCTRFHQGFATRQQRDKHIGQHERAHKCTHEGCDYRELGFPTEGELRKHVELCHRVLPEEPTFPKVQRVNLGKALNDAIDRDDVEAVRDICSGTSECPLRQTGFVLRAMKRRSITTALVLVELLGTDVEMNQVDRKGRTVLHEAVEIRNDNLFDRVLDTGIKLDVRDCNGITPYWSALEHGYFHAIRSLMDHPAIDLIPQKDWQAYEVYHKGMKEAAAAGIDDILKAQFPNFVSVCNSISNPSRSNEVLSEDLMPILAKAASNGHESTVNLILELAHALDLESMYQELLQEGLHQGIEAMTTSPMQRYGEATQEIGKNGKTYGNTLPNAAMEDDSAHVMRLLEKGADIDSPTSELSFNALGAASFRGNLSMVKLLVKQGADINAKGGSSGNALNLACTGEHMAVVNFLFEIGADVDARLNDGGTALIGASSGGRRDAVQFLVGKAANVDIQREDGETALFQASRYGYKDVVEILLRGRADVNLQSKSGEIAIFPASRNGHEEIVGILLRCRADVNLQSKSGETALFQASRNGHKRIVEILLRYGADVNLQSKSGETALFEALEKGKREVAHVLIRAGVDIEVMDSYGRTALWPAAEKGWEDTVQILIDRGADVNVQNIFGETVLFAAYQGGHKEIIRILLAIASGAESLATALSKALMKRQGDILQLLLKQASPSQQWAAVLMLVEDETAMATTGSVYDEALYLACSYGLEELIEVLLEVGAQLTIPVEIYDRALGLIGSRKYVPTPEYEAIAKLLRERRALAALQH